MITTRHIDERVAPTYVMIESVRGDSESPGFRSLEERSERVFKSIV